MHTLNLGMVTFVVGSALRVLVREHHWAGGTEERQLKEGFKTFNEWAKRMKIPYLAYKPSILIYDRYIYIYAHVIII